jgi:hypothetical protein
MRVARVPNWHVGISARPVLCPSCSPSFLFLFSVSFSSFLLFSFSF